jgi:hypothetical protein
MVPARITEVRDHPSFYSPRDRGSFEERAPACLGCCSDCAVFAIAKELVRKGRTMVNRRIQRGRSTPKGVAGRYSARNHRRRADIFSYAADLTRILVSALGIEPRTP